MADDPPSKAACSNVKTRLRSMPHHAGSKISTTNLPPRTKGGADVHGRALPSGHSQLEIRSVHRLDGQQSALIIVKPGAKPPAQPLMLESMLALSDHPP
ncbi:hypothetical protein ALQ28_103327 [Pseudomonas syringae pv. delphinii]|uniref:Uncharacterized protein n=1 Tax=Pseudomonas syringae pv. delphinii TaxID=192088 RepID=A0A0P9PBW3_9PSED|nr:hypothetical protein ALO72_102820 [Pseudomonas syringae pv. delphinii]RMP11254.1 hypothetical protein ALQ28_103327 [Pseudomonas syringae pv. delphinii]